MFWIVSDPERRHQGLGRRLTVALCQAGLKAGAETAYLQAEVDNEPAINLYASLGFRDVYQYWYRRQA